MKSIDEVERKRYKEAVSKLNLIAGLPFFVALYYVKDIRTLLTITSLFVLFALVSGYRMHKKLKTLGFNPEVHRRLIKCSFLFVIGMILMLVPLFIGSNFI